jgi:cytoskeletal protein CcmA (bactofilin family)
MASAGGGSNGVIGRGITIRGSLTGQEPLIVEGRIEGNVGLRNHMTVESTGVVVADVEVDNLTVLGEVHGNVQAGEAVSVAASAKVVGNIRAPRVIIEDGARFKGGIEMDFELPEGLGSSRKR